MKKLSVPAIGMALYAGLTADQWIAILSAIVTIINAIIEIIKALKERKKEKSGKSA